MCATMPGWRHLVKAMEVTAGHNAAFFCQMSVEDADSQSHTVCDRPVFLAMQQSDSQIEALLRHTEKVPKIYMQNTQYLF